MVTATRLTVLTGPHKNRKFCLGGPNRCQVGRAFDCFIQLSGAERDRLISRYHCQLDIDPPSVWVRDLGSANGTFVNGMKVEPNRDEVPDEAGFMVQSGSLLTVGGTTLSVDIVECPRAQNDLAGEPFRQAVDCPLPC
jgi:predicted component of type VI protein secretion system